MVNVAIFGSGGREYSIAKYISLSKEVTNVYIIPGNGGTSFIPKCINKNLKLSDFTSIVDFCKDQLVKLAVIGPEEPLINGLADVLKKNHIKCFGPCSAAARLEGSKSFAKEIMMQCGIATAKYKHFVNVNEALKYLDEAPEYMRVVKADGIAAGKGVVVCQSLEEAKSVVSEMLDTKNPKFGDQSSKIVIEELLEGPEISVLAFCDGKNIRCFPPSQDHKQVYDGDMGPNTGGMGAYCPCDLVDMKTIKCIEKEIIQKIITYLAEMGIIYQGIIYAGIMLTKKGPYVLEFNCRFGDPETEVILPILKSDLYEVMLACTEFGGLDLIDVNFHADRYALGIVLVSGGYPNTYNKGYPINGLESVNKKVHIIHAGTRYNELTKQFETNGGRVLCIVAIDEKLEFSYNMSMNAIKNINFQDMFYRKDIGKKALHVSSALTYSGSGVNIDKGDELVDQIKRITSMNCTLNGTLSQIGQFGAIFDLSQVVEFKDPLLVSGTDGVGTKLRVAMDMNKHDTIGQDLVAMCVNDVLCHGARPLFFLDYYATGRLDTNIAHDVIWGINKACQECGCALVGGETAEMPGFYHTGDYDVAGFVVGVVERDHLLPRLDHIQEGDVLIGLGSTGLHSNGYSLARKIVDRQINNVRVDETGDKENIELIKSQLLTPTAIYVNYVLPLFTKYHNHIHSITHVTGGGLPENLSRSIPTHLAAHLDTFCWEIPFIFRWLYRHSNRASVSEFSRTFNLGVGMVLVVKQQHADDIIEDLNKIDAGICLGKIGSVVAKQHKTDYSVVISNLEQQLVTKQQMSKNVVSKKCRVGVLISGSGTNLEAILEYERQNRDTCQYKVCLVLSNVPNVGGLDIASKYGVPTEIVSHRTKTREQFDNEINEILCCDSYQIDLICLAGFMRILTPDFTEHKWPGRIINIHPSLLPSFRGAHAHKAVLESGVRVSGATAHFVVADIDAGGIIRQGTVLVLKNDTEESLANRIKKEVEHKIYPLALDDVASGRCYLGPNNKVVWIQ